MPLPPEVDKLIRDRLSKLTTDASQLSENFASIFLKAKEEHPYRNYNNFLNQELPSETFYTIKSSLLALIDFMSLESHHLSYLADVIQDMECTIGNVGRLAGFIKSLESDYDAGVLDRLSYRIEAGVVTDYLEQAIGLLESGQSDNYALVLASVLTGVILEDSLRRLCQRQSPSIPIKNKKMNTMIEDLKKAGLYNELKAKHLRAWAGVRNAAAHGQFDEFDRNDVEQMLAGVQQFLTDYL